MAVLYSGIQGHAYLSAKSLALSEGKLVQEQILAESLLGLGEPIFTGVRDLEETLLAIVIQINFQVAQGIDPFYQKAASSSHTKQSVIYLDRMVDPRAARIIEEVIARSGIGTLDSRYANLVSLRTNDWP